MLILGSLEGRLQDVLGLDMIHITTGSIDPFRADDGRQSKFLQFGNRKIPLPTISCLSLTTGVNNDQKSVGFRYDLVKISNATAWRNDRGITTLGANWQYRF